MIEQQNAKNLGMKTLIPEAETLAKNTKIIFKKRINKQELHSLLQDISNG